MKLEKLFLGEIKPNVYLIPRSESLSSLSSLAKEYDFSLFVFEGQSIHDMDEFPDQFEKLMRPPEYGRNWNSFKSYFRICIWIETKGIVVVYRDFQNFMMSKKHDYDKSDFDQLIDIFVQMARFRSRLNEKFQIVPFYVLLQGADNANLPIDRM